MNLTAVPTGGRELVEGSVWQNVDTNVLYVLHTTTTRYHVPKHIGITPLGYEGGRQVYEAATFLQKFRKMHLQPTPQAVKPARETKAQLVERLETGAARVESDRMYRHTRSGVAYRPVSFALDAATLVVHVTYAKVGLGRRILWSRTVDDFLAKFEPVGNHPPT